MRKYIVEIRQHAVDRGYYTKITLPNGVYMASQDTFTLWGAKRWVKRTLKKLEKDKAGVVFIAEGNTEYLTRRLK